jgi:hypothetical protein
MSVYADGDLGLPVQAGNMDRSASTASDDLKFCIFAPPWIFCCSRANGS